jgi:hypothetical protein
VDAEKIWGTGNDRGQADHVVVVAGVDETRGMVILSDPGNPKGNMEEVPISQFDAAWRTSGDEMLVANAPDPHVADRDGVAAADAGPWAMVDLRN